MESRAPTGKAAWEAPTATALTDTESRADHSDVWMQNGTPANGS